MQMLDHFRMRPMGILDFQLWHKVRSVIILTGPGKQCLTARKMFVWPWPVPRGNPVVYVSMSLKDRHKILRGCKSDNGTSEDINEKGCLLKHIKCRILIKSIRTVFDVRMNHAEGNMYIKSTIQCWLDSAENNILKHIIVMDGKNKLPCLRRFYIFYSANVKTWDCCQLSPKEIKCIHEVRYQTLNKKTRLFTYGGVQWRRGFLGDKLLHTCYKGSIWIHKNRECITLNHSKTNQVECINNHHKNDPSDPIPNKNELWWVMN